VDDILASFDRWHADEMRRIDARTRGLRAAILGSGVLLLVAGVVAWLF
jgi:hypothetical protein